MTSTIHSLFRSSFSNERNRRARYHPLSLVLVIITSVVAGCSTTANQFDQADPLARAGDVAKSSSLSSRATLELDSAGFWRVTPRERDDQFRSPPTDGTILVARRADASDDRAHLFAVATANRDELRLNRLTTGELASTRGPWRLRRWRPSQDASLRYGDANRTACLGNQAPTTSDCLLDARPASRWWVYPVSRALARATDSDSASPPTLDSTSPILVHRNPDYHDAPLERLPHAADFPREWLAVPAPIGPPAVPSIRIGVDETCPTLSNHPSSAGRAVVRTTSLSKADISKLDNPHPLTTSTLAVEHGIDLAVRCQSGRITAAAPVLFRRLHHTYGDLDHPWWLGLKPLQWRKQSDMRLRRLTRAMGLVTAGDPVAAEALLSRVSPTSSRSEATVWARLAGASAAAGRPESGLRKLTIASRHAWHPESDPGSLLARSDAFAAIGWSRRAGTRRREALESAGTNLRDRLNWFGQWSDLRRRWRRGGDVALSEHRRRRLEREDREHDALAVRLLSMVGRATDSISRDARKMVRKQAKRLNITPLHDAIVGRLDSLSCESDGACTPDAYARRRPSTANATFSVASVSRTPFSILRLSDWDNLLQAAETPGETVRATELRRRLPWSHRHSTHTATVFIDLLASRDDCVGLSLYAPPDEWFGARNPGGDLYRVLATLTSKCERPVATANQLADTMQSGDVSQPAGRLADAGFAYLAQLGDSPEAVESIADAALGAFRNTRHPGCTRWHLFGTALASYQSDWKAVDSLMTSALNCGDDESMRQFRSDLQTYRDVQLGHTTPSSVPDNVARATLFGSKATPLDRTVCAGAHLPRPSPKSLLPQRLERLWPYDAEFFDQTPDEDDQKPASGLVVERRTRATQLQAGLRYLRGARQSLNASRITSGVESLRRAGQAFDDAAYIPGKRRTTYLLWAFDASDNAAQQTQRDRASTDNRRSGKELDDSSTCPSETSLTDESDNADANLSDRRRLRCTIAQGSAPAWQNLKPTLDTDASCSQIDALRPALRWLQDDPDRAFEQVNSSMSSASTDGETCAQTSRERLCRWTD